MTDPETNNDWSAEGGRASASRIRQGLDEMASSVREMEAFLQSAEKPVSGSAAQPPKPGKRRGRPKGSKTSPEKLARQASKRERAKAARGGAARPPQPAPEPPAPPAAEPPAPPAARPDAPDPAFGVPAEPAPAASTMPDASAESVVQHSAFSIQHSSGRPAPVPAADLPTIRAEDLYALSPEDLLSLAREQDVFARAAVRTRADAVFDLLVKHARRGGAVEGSGYFEYASPFDAPAGEGGQGRGGFRSGSGGFLRSPANGLRPAPGDVAVPQELRDRFGLRPGDHVVCRTRLGTQGSRQGQFEATELVSVNGGDPARSRLAPSFPALPAEPPSRRLRLRSAAAPSAALDALDALAPLAFGSRGLLLAPRAAFPECSALLRAAAAAAAANHPAAKVVMLRLGAAGEPAPAAPGAFLELSTDFDDPPDRHARAFAGAVDLARREAERGRDVVLLVDSLAAALGPAGAGFEPGGRRGGAAEDAALAAIRRAAATARALRGGGSVTLLALAADPAAPGPAAAPDAALEALLAPVLDWTAATPDGASFDPARTRSRAIAPDDPALSSSLRALLAGGDAKGAAALLAKLPPPPPPAAAEEIPAFEVPV